MPSLAEVQQFQDDMASVSTLAQRDLTQVWNTVVDLDKSTATNVLTTVTPQIVDEYGALASQLSVDFYGQQLPTSTFEPRPGEPIAFQRMEQSVRWAMYAASAASPLDLLAGSVQRAVFDASRQTIIANTQRERGATWARFASSSACPFCRMLATRGDDYGSAKSAMFTSAGRKYHDNCRCMAVPVRPGESYEPPAYVEKWEQQYKDAVAATKGDGAINAKAVLAHMRQADAATARAVKVAAAPKLPVPVKALEFDKQAGRAWASKVWPYDDSTDLFTEPERLAAFNYTSAGYERSNKILRGVIDGRPHELDNARLLDSMIDKAARVPSDVVVTRTATAAAFGDIPVTNAPALVGRTFRDKAFLSTSVDAVGEGVEAVAGKAPDYVMRLTVPKGSRGVYVSNEDAGFMQQLSGFGKTENELILARGTSYRIDGVEPGIGGKPATLRATLIGQNGEPI